MSGISHSPHGQVTIEFFLALSIFLLVLLWAVNETNSFAQSAGKASAASQAQAIANSAARGMNAACLWGTAVTLHLPCAFESGNFSPVTLTTSSGAWVSVLLPAFNSSANKTLVCPGGTNEQFTYRCDYANGTLACATKVGGVTHLQLGGCP